MDTSYLDALQAALADAEAAPTDPADLALRPDYLAELSAAIAEERARVYGAG